MTYWTLCTTKPFYSIFLFPGSSQRSSQAADIPVVDQLESYAAVVAVAADIEAVAAGTSDVVVVADAVGPEAYCQTPLPGTLHKVQIMSVQIVEVHIILYCVSRKY